MPFCHFEIALLFASRAIRDFATHYFLLTGTFFLIRFCHCSSTISGQLQVYGHSVICCVKVLNKNAVFKFSKSVIVLHGPIPRVKFVFTLTLAVRDSYAL